nr:MAG TPA: hypothetical protein [Caudoviricetes sp.]
MAAIKFEIDGKTYDFTSENFWEKFIIDSKGNIILKPKTEKRSPFERVGEDNGKVFYAIDCYGKVAKLQEGVGCVASALHEVANYCTDDKLLQRRALYEKLERCLWRFSIENGGSGDYYPILNRETRKWTTTYTETQRFGPSFKTYETCARAIDEIIIPMLDGIAEEEIFSWRRI